MRLQIFQTKHKFSTEINRSDHYKTNTCNATNIDSPKLNDLLSISQLFYIIKKFIISSIK
jgi:hypothetical protein